MIGKINDVVRKELMINASQRRAFQASAWNFPACNIVTSSPSSSHFGRGGKCRGLVNY